MNMYAYIAGSVGDFCKDMRKYRMLGYKITFISKLKIKKDRHQAVFLVLKVEITFCIYDAGRQLAVTASLTGRPHHRSSSQQALVSVRLRCSELPLLELKLLCHR